MKLCIDCAHVHNAVDWRCPHCRATPPTIQGFLAFAPSLARASGGMPDDSATLLDALQGLSFWFRARNRLIIDLIRRYATDPRAILEIGCGTGFVLDAVSHAFPVAQLTGSEVSARALSFARRRVGERVQLVQMDARHMPYDSEFDVVAAFDVLEHIAEDMKVLAAMTRAVRPGGYIILTVPQHPMLWSITDEVAGHERRYRRRELSEKMSASGLRVVLDTSFVASLFPAMLAQRLTKGSRRDYDPSDEFRLPRWVDRLFEFLLDTERHLIGYGVRFPFGGSRVVVARRP